MKGIDFLSLGEVDKKAVIEDVSASLGLTEIAIEKDWWVCFALRVIFESKSKNELSDGLIFKGGTSLSKGYKAIERFSEDIDLALNSKELFLAEVTGKSQLDKLRKRSAQYIKEEFFPILKSEIENQNVEGLSATIEQVISSDQDPICIFLQFPSVSAISNYIMPVVKLEISCRSKIEPFRSVGISSFIGQELKEKMLNEEEFQVPTAAIERTFLEKIFLLHEEFQKLEGKERVSRMSRHLYDLYKLSFMNETLEVLNNKELYESIVRHRSIFNKIRGIDYSNHIPSRIRIKPPQEKISLWQNDYIRMQEEMIYQSPSPNFEEVIDRIEYIENTLKQAAW